MGIYYEDRFRVVFNHLYLDPKHTDVVARDSSHWMITFSNEDLTSAQTFQRKKVWVGEDGLLPFNYLEVSNSNDKDYMRLILKVKNTPWNYQYWAKLGDYVSPWKTEEMGDFGKNIGIKKDSWRGGAGKKVYAKVQVEASSFPKGQTGHDTINVPSLFQNLYKYGEEAHTVDLPNHYGSFSYSILPVTQRTEPVKKRHLARGGADPSFQVHQLGKLKLPGCCLDILVQMQWRVKIHNRVQNSLKYKNWAMKIIDPKWITDTAKKLRNEAENQIKSTLKPPKDTDVSMEGQIIMMSALLLANDLVGLSDHYTDHAGDLEDLWTEVHEAFVEWSDGLAEKATQNIDQKILKQVVGSSYYKQKR